MKDAWRNVLHGGDGLKSFAVTPAAACPLDTNAQCRRFDVRRTCGGTPYSEGLQSVETSASGDQTGCPAPKLGAQDVIKDSFMRHQSSLYMAKWGRWAFTVLLLTLGA